MSKVWKFLKKTSASKKERETLMRELERERMLRVDAEQRLQVVAEENDSGKSRLQSLQDEFRKMEEMVRSMIQYKGKLDEMKQAKMGLTINYENNLQKLRTHVGNLEHENKILMAEIKNIESKCANCHLCNKEVSYRMTKMTPLSPTQTNSTQADGEPGDKTKVLLERLKMLEAEKSGLVLENENQRQQYEKCLDEIANQVVQALMSQKTLREECAKLQKRVQDLEAQNRQLTQMFQQKIKFASESVLQSLASKRLLPSSGMCVASTSSSGSTSSANLSASTQVTYVNGQFPRAVPLSGERGLGMGSFSEVSLESLQSICSDYNEQLHCEDNLGQPQLSSPPPWLRDRVFQPGESPTSSIASPCTMLDGSQGSDVSEHVQRGKPFGASSSSSSDRSDRSNKELRKFLPVGHTAHHGDASPRTGKGPGHYKTAHNSRGQSTKGGNVTNFSKIPNEFREDQSPSSSSAPGHLVQCPKNIHSVRIETEFPADKASPKMKHLNLNNQISGENIPSGFPTTPPHPPLDAPSIANKRDDILRALTALTDKTHGFNNNTCHKGVAHGNTDVSPAQELLSLSDSFPEKFTIHDRDGLPRIQNNLFDDSDSDDSYSTQPFTKDFSGASTVSLNELLDQGLEDIETPNSENYSLDDFHFGDTDEEKIEILDNSSPKFQDMIQAGRAVLECESIPSMRGHSYSKSRSSMEDQLCTNSSSSQTVPGLNGVGACDTNPGAIDHKQNPNTFIKEPPCVPLNNQTSVVSCKPPLPRPLSRPNSLDLATNSKLPKTEPKSCLEYSSDSDSDKVSDCANSPRESESKHAEDKLSPTALLTSPTKSKRNIVYSPESIGSSSSKESSQFSPQMRSPSKSEYEAFNKQLQNLAKEQHTENECYREGTTKNSCLANVLGVSKRDCGDYVMLRAPGKLAKLTNQDSGISDIVVVEKSTVSNHSAPPVSSKCVKSLSNSVDPKVKKDITKGLTVEVSPENNNNNIAQNSVRHNVTSSPDSAMQQSFSSSSSGSDTVLGDKPSFRDDGYSSNSGVSFSTTDSISTHGDSLHGSHPSNNNNRRIGKVGAFSPVGQSEKEKAGVWTRDGICNDMKENLERRGSLGSAQSNTSADGRFAGIVSEMKALFEAKTGTSSTDSVPRRIPRERRYSMPSNRDEDGDYVFLDPYWCTGPSNDNTVDNTGQALHTSPNKPSRPKMGIHAKTRSLIQQKGNRNSQPALSSTFPSDPCLNENSDSDVTSPKSGGCYPHLPPMLKRTNSDSCLSGKIRLGRPPVIRTCPSKRSTLSESDKEKHSVQPQDPPKQAKSAKKDKTKSSSLSTLKQHKVSTPKDKNQCIVGYVLSDPPVPNFELDLKIPCLNSGLKCLSPKKEREVRETGEGSEHGYKSGDDHTHHNKRPEVVGSDQRPLVSESYNSPPDIRGPAFDVRKYCQLQQPAQQLAQQLAQKPVQQRLQTQIADPLKRQRNDGLSVWHSNSSDENKPTEIKLIPLTVLNTTKPPVSSPTHQVPPPTHNVPSYNAPLDLCGPPERGYGNYCDVNLNKRSPRQHILSYPPGTHIGHMTDHMADQVAYHTMPAEKVKPQTGDFKMLMENLAKKSEDVLKSKIFHSEPEKQVPQKDVDYDSLLHINFDSEHKPTPFHEQKPTTNIEPKLTPVNVHVIPNTNKRFQHVEVREGEIKDITKEIETLTRTVDDLQRSMSSMDDLQRSMSSMDDLQRSMSSIDFEPRSNIDSFMHHQPMSASGPMALPSYADGSYPSNSYYGDNRQWQVSQQQQASHRVMLRQPASHYQASSSSDEDGADNASFGDAFVKKFRRRKKKSKLQY